MTNTTSQGRYDNNNPRPAAGLPATIRIGTDRYAAKVVGVSPSGKTLRVAFERDGETLRFNWSAVYSRFQSGSYRLTLGEAVTNLDASL